MIEPGALLFASAALWFRAHMGITPHYAFELLPAQLVGGAGVGLVLPTLSAAATGPLPAARFATGTAVLGMSRQLGSALGVAILIAIIGSPAPDAAVAAFRHGWALIIGSAIAAGIVLLAVGPVTIGSSEPAADQRAVGTEPSPATLGA